MDNRYYFNLIQNNKVVLVGQEAQHLSRVRRAKIGDEIVAFNGDGFNYNLKIEEITKDKVICAILSTSKNIATEESKIVVYLWYICFQ